MKKTRTTPPAPGAQADTAQPQGQAQAQAPAAPAKVPEAAPAEEVRATPMEQVRFKPTEYLRNTFLCTAFERTTPQQMLLPEYWAHVAHQMRPRDRVEAWANDGTWMAEFVVLDASRAWARVQLLNVHHFTTSDQARTQADAMNPYEVTHRGPHSQWSVVRKSDRMVVSEGHATIDQATNWLKERMKAER